MTIFKESREASRGGPRGRFYYKSVQLYELRRAPRALVIRRLVRKLLTSAEDGVDLVRYDSKIMKLHAAKELKARLRVENKAGRFLNVEYQRAFGSDDELLPFVCAWEKSRGGYRQE